MKRLALVLFVCFSVQMSAMSAPLVHLHADADHDTEHHGGRAVHRHVESHDTAVHHHQGGDRSRHSMPAADASSVGGDGEPAPQSSAGVNVAPATTITSAAWPATAFAAWSRTPSRSPCARAESQIPTPPDISPPSVRGPPR